MSNELVPHGEPNLSIFQIESELAELMELRDTEELAPEERQAVDIQIAEYVSRELTKVDGIRSFVRHGEMRIAEHEALADQAKHEAARQMAFAISWQNKVEYLKGCCLMAMAILQKKKLEGLTGAIVAKGNGGLQALTIYDEGLLPSLCKTLSIQVNLAEWERFANECNQMAQSMQVALSRLMTSQCFQSEIMPDNRAIRKALEKPCDICEGRGKGYGDPNQGIAGPSCKACDGTGKARVPGARLEPRGTHIEVK